MAVQYRPTGSTANEIAESIERGVRDGHLQPGDLLPTVRRLADDLGVSPGTTAAAYRQLQNRAVVVSDGRRGTRVGRRPPVASTRALPTRRISPARRAPTPAGRDFASGNPDPALLPELGPVLVRQARRPRLYRADAMIDELGEVARPWLEADDVDASHLTVVNGAMDGVERVLSAWAIPGDRVIVEDPGYAAVLDLVAAMGLRAVPVAVDDAGLDPGRFERALATGPVAVIVTPRAQNPIGAAHTAERAEVLRALLRDHPDVLVIEDDHAGPIAGAPLVSLVGERGRERWAFIRSVAKALGPDLRCALVAGDPTTVARVEGRLALGPGWVSGLLQGAVADLLSRVAITKLCARATRIYAERRVALVEALAHRGLEAHGRSGLNVWVPVADETQVVGRLLAAGVAVAPGSRYRLASPPAVRITTALLDRAEADWLADLVAEAQLATVPRSG